MGRPLTKNSPAALASHRERRRFDSSLSRVGGVQPGGSPIGLAGGEALHGLKPLSGDHPAAPIGRVVRLEGAFEGRRIFVHPPSDLVGDAQYVDRVSKLAQRSVHVAQTGFGVVLNLQN